MIVTALLVDANICIPSVFTMSGSSTPWTWTLVPVYEGVDCAALTVVPAWVTTWVSVDTIVTPVITGPPKKIPPLLLYCWALLALVAMKLWSSE